MAPSGIPQGEAGPAPRIGVVARDPLLPLVVACAAGGAAPVVLATDEALLAAVLQQLTGLSHLLVEEGAPGFDPGLLDALAEASPQAVIATLPRGAEPTTVRALLAEAGAAPARGTGTLRPGGLMLRYQPIVSLRDGRMTGVEALARWASDPVALTPIHFVPAMERMGLGKALAGAVTRLATQDMARLPWPLKVSVNLSVAEFERRDVAAWLARESRRARLPASRLVIELTETAPVVDRARLARALRRLRAAGHEVVMDDFILDDPRRRLLGLPFTGVKLDRSMVRRLNRCPRGRAQVRAMVKRGLVLTAEGVASRADMQLLRHLGVQRVQGFWLARPLPVQALMAWARRRVAQPRKTRA
ncbi:EAL domain-containing protein [Roseococcus sp. DSY-14]|uniref:EAL domain-containing protein n=1 Tax=Roseococcus sp. DSY-14 TaxID=3369650 RepID=UPI00387B94C7